MTRIERIHAALTEALAPSRLEITDDSAQHAGHAGARGGGHYSVSIVASAFAGKSAIERHRMVYAALAGLMPIEVHAVSIKAAAPDEAAA